MQKKGSVNPVRLVTFALAKLKPFMIGAGVVVGAAVVGAGVGVGVGTLVRFAFTAFTLLLSKSEI